MAISSRSSRHPPPDAGNVLSVVMLTAAAPS
jgi:hypothetical protein